jgi:polyisoprenoid-binding protein YceI
MNIKFLYNGLISAGLITLTLTVAAQENYTMVMEHGMVTVSGTSNLHDWEMQMEDFGCDMEISSKNPSLKIQSVSFSGLSTSIKSNSSIMNKKTYDAIQADQYPEIRFENASPEDIPLDTESFEGILSGDLFLAGKTGKIDLPFSGSIISEEEIRISGSKKLKMSDYDIDPPTAMLGTLKTGDEVTISFNLVFHHKSPL